MYCCGTPTILAPCRFLIILKLSKFTSVFQTLTQLLTHFFQAYFPVFSTFHFLNSLLLSAFVSWPALKYCVVRCRPKPSQAVGKRKFGHIFHSQHKRATASTEFNPPSLRLLPYLRVTCSSFRKRGRSVEKKRGHNAGNILTVVTVPCHKTLYV